MTNLYVFDTDGDHDIVVTAGNIREAVFAARDLYEEIIGWELDITAADITCIFEGVLDLNDFLSQYTPVTNHIDDTHGFNGCKFETHGLELDFVLKQVQENPLRVWTITESDGKWHIVSGYRLMGRLGFLLTEEDGPTGAVDYLYD